MLQTLEHLDVLKFVFKIRVVKVIEIRVVHNDEENANEDGDNQFLLEDKSNGTLSEFVLKAKVVVDLILKIVFECVSQHGSCVNLLSFQFTNLCNR